MPEGNAAAGARGDAGLEAAVREHVETVLRPMIQVDGGDVVFASLSGDGSRVTLRFRGDCSRCPAAPVRLVGWIAQSLERALGRPFEVVPVFERPYFYR